MSLDAEFRFLESDAARVGRTTPPPQVERIDVDLGGGRTVSGIAYDPGSAPRLVALHGAGLNAHSFDPMLLALGLPAIAFDLPGHGRSSWRADARYAPDRLAPDLAAACARRLAGPVTLLGHSLGGLTAALVAAARPDLVERLIIVDITPGVTPESDAGSVSEFITGQRDFGDVEEIVERAIAFGIGDDRAALARGIELNTRLRPDGRLEWSHHFAHLGGVDAGMGDDPRPFDPVWEALRALTVPVTLIRADRGMVGDSLVAQWRDRLPDAAVVTLPGPHNLHEAAPAELAAAVRRILDTAGTDSDRAAVTDAAAPQHNDTHARRTRIGQ